MDTITVALPPEIVEPVTRLLPDSASVAVVAWDGTGMPSRDDVDFLVPGYAVGQGPEALRDVLSRVPDVRVVQLLSAGVEPWDQIVPDGVTLCAGTGIHGGSTAELAVALVLASLRDLPAYAAQQARGEWRRHSPDTVIGKRVLVLGAGDIGSRVARTLESLEAEVHLAARTRHLSMDGARALLPEIDVVVVTLPLTDQTRGLVGADWIDALPPGALLVNVARGAIVDTAALTDAVLADRVRCALDVTDPEPLPSDHPLWAAPGALITPHAAGGATGWQERGARLVADQIQRFAGGLPLQHTVSDGY